MNTRSIAATKRNFLFNFKAPFLAAGAVSAAGQSRSQRKRISALMRLACRVLGMKHRGGTGLGLLGIVAAAGFSAVSPAMAQALPGVYINAGGSNSCIHYLSDRTLLNQSSDVAADPATHMRVLTTGNCSPADAATQTGRVLFYGTGGVAGVPSSGPKSLSLGGELFVNGGFIGVGVAKAPISIGNNGTLAIGEGSIAIGQNAKAVGRTNNFAGPSAGVRGGLAIGNGAQANNGGLAIGEGAVTHNVDGGTSTALGHGAQATGSNSLALGGRFGYSAIASGDGSFAVGNSSAASGVSAMSMGRQSIASANGAIAMGQGANASGENSVAIGADSGFNADGNGLGAAKASGPQAVAIGFKAVANGSKGTAIGTLATASAADAFAGGRGALVESAQGVALGASAKVPLGAIAGVALGSGARVEHGSGVALGTGAVTDDVRKVAPVVLNGTTYAPRGETPGSVVSVGTAAQPRQIINAGPGSVNATSTDVVVGQQLHAAYTEINKLGAKDVELEARLNKLPKGGGAESVLAAMGPGTTVSPTGELAAKAEAGQSGR